MGEKGGGKKSQNVEGINSNPINFKEGGGKGVAVVSSGSRISCATSSSKRKSG